MSSILKSALAVYFLGVSAAFAADLPLRQTSSVHSSVELFDTPAETVIAASPRRTCPAGFVIDADEVCRRHGELALSCQDTTSGCRILLPSPLPYDQGPAQRLNY